MAVANVFVDVVAHDVPVASAVAVTLQLAMLLLPLTFLVFQLLLWSLAVAGVPTVVNIPLLVFPTVL